MSEAKDLGIPLVVPPEAYNTLKVNLAAATGICASVARICPAAAVERLHLLEQTLARCTEAVGGFTIRGAGDHISEKEQAAFAQEFSQMRRSLLRIKRMSGCSEAQRVAVDTLASLGIG